MYCSDQQIRFDTVFQSF